MPTKFILGRSIARGRLRIGGLCYEAYLNGRRAGHKVLDLPSTAYIHAVLHATFGALRPRAVQLPTTRNYD